MFSEQDTILRHRFFFGAKFQYYVLQLTVEAQFALAGSSVDDRGGHHRRVHAQLDDRELRRQGHRGGAAHAVGLRGLRLLSFLASFPAPSRRPLASRSAGQLTHITVTVWVWPPPAVDVRLRVWPLAIWANCAAEIVTLCAWPPPPEMS